MKKVILILSALVFLSCAEVDQDYVFNEQAYNEYNETETNEMIKYSDWADVTGDSTIWTAEAINDTAQGAKDGTGWRKEIPGEWWGFIQAIMKAANVQPNDVLDTADASQILDALRSLDVPLTRLSDGMMNVSHTASGHTYTMIINTLNPVFGVWPYIELIDNTDATTEKVSLKIENNVIEMTSTDASGLTQTFNPTVKGLKFGGTGHPTNATPMFNKSVLSMGGLTTLTFSNLQDGNGDILPSWKSSVPVDLKIPVACNIFGVNARFDNANNDFVSSVDLANLDNSGATWKATVIVKTDSAIISPPRYNVMNLTIDFDGTNL